MIPCEATPTMLASLRSEADGFFESREASNRCLAVTDEGESAWQNRAIRCKAGALKSVCRELPPYRWPHQGHPCNVGVGTVACRRTKQKPWNAFRKEQTLAANVTEWRFKSDETDGLAKAVRTEARKLFHVGAVRPKGVRQCVTV